MNYEVSFSELLDTVKASAIALAFEPTNASVYRSLCRKYAITFHTPLHLVEQMLPEHVLQHVFEHQMDEIDIDEQAEHLLEMLMKIEDPEYDAKAEAELMDFAEMAQAEEEERLAQGRKIGEKPRPPKPVEKNPTEGSLNLSYFNEENER